MKIGIDVTWLKPSKSGGVESYFRNLLDGFLELKDDNTYYLRMCSIDSPFREQIIWNYMQTSCRPGVPDRNVDNWAVDIKN